MRLCVCSPAFSVMTNPPRTTVLAVDYWKARNTRGRRSFAGGKFLKCCCRAITLRLRRGERNRANDGPNKIGRTFSGDLKNKKAWHPEPSKGTRIRRQRVRDHASVQGSDCE